MRVHSYDRSEMQVPGHVFVTISRLLCAHNNAELLDYYRLHGMVDRALLAPSYEETSAVCKEILDDVIGQKPYQHTEVVKWNQEAIEKMTERLAKLNRPYKYCICCVIMQTGVGAGLNVSSSCYWDRNNDSANVIRWESRAVIAICNVFAVSISS